MTTQILYLLFVAGVLTGIARSQNVTEEEDNDAPNVTVSQDTECEKPDMPDIIQINKTKKPGSFPRTELNYLLYNPTIYADYTYTKKLETCSRIRPKTEEPVSGPGLDTCSIEKKVFEIPKFISDNNVRCWVVPHWHSFCQYVTCRDGFVNCNGVTATNETLTPKCIETNWKTIYYYIICPKPWKLQKRSVRLPQSCSCQEINCQNP